MPSASPPPPLRPKNSRTNLVIIGSAVAVIAAVVATGVVVVQATDNDSKPAAVETPAEEVTNAASDDPAPRYAGITVNSFTIKLRTTKRQCFGSAGCNMTLEPSLTYLGDSASINPHAVYEITYEIHGDESGPVIETAELSRQTRLNYTPSSISTASAGTRVSVEITDVALQGE
ncbi:hypothetical protein GT045_13115 [Streptomyces sp. SID486]|nr:hypothetical protein [Streptomyces sp. SID486]